MYAHHIIACIIIMHVLHMYMSPIHQYMFCFHSVASGAGHIVYSGEMIACGGRGDGETSGIII